MTVLSTLLAGLIALLAAGTADVSALFMARQRAIAAAESAALAAADAATWLNDHDPVAEAERLAEANGAELARCQCDEGAGEVLVEVVVTPRTRFVTAWLGARVRVARRATVAPWVPSWAP